jgi:uroporphyrinogen decarboxylase
MNHRERVRALLSGAKPIRPVVDLGGRVASLSTPAYLALKQYLGLGSQLEGETVTSLNTIGEIDERILQRFDVPFRRLYLRPASTFNAIIEAGGSFCDEWGVGYRPMGDYNERVGHPLADATLADLETYPWPDPSDPGRVLDLEQEVQQLYGKTDYSLVAGHISAGIFQDCWNLRGMEKFFTDLALDPDFANAMLDRVTSIHIGMWNSFLDVVGDFVDVVETADDLAGQEGLLISPKMYREMIKPRHAALNAAIREKTNANILYHSCGAVMPLIPDLIEVGVKILNPIQPLPGLLDPEELLAKFGDRLIFHGGLDVQRLLPEGSPSQVRAHVIRYYDALGTDHYIMAPSNSVQPGNPPQNLVSAYDTALGYAS